MRVSQRLDYVLRALTAMAQLPQGTSVVAGDLAVRLNLPKRFLEQQMTALAKRGLVNCQRGAGGGCLLARPAEDISVGDVVRALHGTVLDVPHVTGSAVAEMWQGAARSLEDSLDRTSLRSLADRQGEIDAVAEPMYYI